MVCAFKNVSFDVRVSHSNARGSDDRDAKDADCGVINCY